MAYCRGCKVATTAPFVVHKAEVAERLRQAPAVEQGYQPTRWTLQRIRNSFDFLQDYSLSGVWRLMQRLDLGWRWARAAQFSPDPAYEDKVAYLLACLRTV